MTNQEECIAELLSLAGDDKALIENLREELSVAKAEIDRLRCSLEDIANGPDNLNDYFYGIRCGLEDADLQGNSPYVAAEYGYEKGLEYCSFIATQALAPGEHKEESE